MGSSGTRTNWEIKTRCHWILDTICEHFNCIFRGYGVSEVLQAFEKEQFCRNPCLITFWARTRREMELRLCLKLDSFCEYSKWIIQVFVTSDETQTFSGKYDRSKNST